MDSIELKALSEIVQKFKSSLVDYLNQVNNDFHEILNGEEALEYKGIQLNNIEEPNKYLINVSELMFWHDPIAYINELDSWEGQKINTKHHEISKYLNDTSQQNIFYKLVGAIKRKRISPFVGAGLSLPCGFPLWGGTINKVVEKLNGVSISEERAAQPGLEYLNDVIKHIENNKYIEAVDILYNKARTHLDNFINTTFSLNSDLEIKGPVNLLPLISDGCIITTNFDDVIETVFINNNKPIQGYMHGTQTKNQFAAKLVQGDRCILKLHGTVSDPETYIFSKTQYDEAYGNNENKNDFTKSLAKTLRQIFVSHSLLFLGCSLGQDRTLSLFQEVFSSNEFDIPEHFAILPDPDNNSERLSKEELLQKAKIKVIWYKVIKNGNKQDHSNLENLLKFAIDCAHGKAKI